MHSERHLTMTKRELNTRLSSKYGTLDRTYTKQIIENHFVTSEPDMCYYRYRIKNQYSTLFNKHSIYVKGKTLYEAQLTISMLLKAIKLF